MKSFTFLSLRLQECIMVIKKKRRYLAHKQTKKQITVLDKHITRIK
jgi:hypothetical protein